MIETRKVVGIVLILGGILLNAANWFYLKTNIIFVLSAVVAVAGFLVFESKKKEETTHE
jgi:general stress protein CsbA